jgi:hypothetical protein
MLRRWAPPWGVLASGDGPALGNGFRETVDLVEHDRDHDERALALSRLGDSLFPLSAAWCAVRARQRPPPSFVVEDPTMTGHSR